MSYGNIDCDCGQTFYFETTHSTIGCIKCRKIHDVTECPVKSEEDEVIDEVEQDFVERMDYTSEEGEENGAHV